MKPWILLVGTSYSAAPILGALRDLGFYVAVCGARPQDPCVHLADRYHDIDYSDFEALLTLTKRERYQRLCPACNDYAYLSSSYVAEALGLPGYDTFEKTITLHDKRAFRVHAERIGLNVPQLYNVESLGEAKALKLPVLVKPTDSFSGRGVRRVEKLSQLGQAILDAREESRGGSALIEEFVEGTLHSHSAFIMNGCIFQDFFVDEFCQAYPYQVDCSNAPSRLPETVREKMRHQVIKLVSSLELSDGLIHTQFIERDGTPYVIEVMRRCPGDLYYNLIKFCTGANYVNNYISAFAGTSMNTDIRTEQFWVRHTVSFLSDSVFLSLSPQLPQALDVRLFPLVESTSKVRGAPYGKVAIVFARLPSRGLMVEISSKMGELFRANTLKANNG